MSCKGEQDTGKVEKKGGRKPDAEAEVEKGGKISAGQKKRKREAVRPKKKV